MFASLLQMPAKTENATSRKIWHLLQKIGIHPAYLIVPLALSLGAAVFDGTSVGLLIPILNGFLQKSFAFVWETPVVGRLFAFFPEAITANDRYLFLVLLGVFVVSYFLKNILRFSSIVSLSYFGQRSLHHLRKSLFAKYLTFGKLYFDTTNVGHHHTLLLEFTRKAMHPLMTVDKCISGLFSVTVYLTVLLIISWKLTLFALPLFIVLHLAVRTIMTRIRQSSRMLSQSGADLGKKSTEILSTIALVKSHRTEKTEQRLYTDISDKVARIDYRVHVLQAIILPLQESIVMVVSISTFIAALYLFGREELGSAPSLIVYFYVVINMSSKFGLILSFQSQLAAANGPLDEVLQIFDDKGKFFVTGGDREFGGLQKGIECRRVTFSYGEGRSVLRDVSFVIHAGKTTALVGPTGAGKSTLIHLLMRHYDCPPQSIFVDGIDIREFQLDSYISHVALVSQETLLLHDSLRSNITYGLTGISEDALRQAVERARLGTFVDQLPQGLDTLVGDRGVKLSGGEKQRVSIARALLKDADILILDEATSSLDSQTENLIQEAIQEAVKDRTAIVIAHRLSTIKSADDIVVLKDGQVEEQGSVESLLAKKGLFFTLWQEQKF